MSFQPDPAWEHAIDALNERCGWDCELSAFDGWRLQMSSGTSEQTQHPFASFIGVSFLSCPVMFSHPIFRLATAAEQAHVRTLCPLEDDDKVIAIDAETMASLGSRLFFIVAQAVDVVPR